MRLDEALEDVTARRADEPFLLHGEEVVTYGEALARINGLCWELSELGVEHGSRVAVVLPNLPEAVYTWLALARLGAVMVPLNPALVPSEVEPLLERLGVVGLVGEAKPVAAYGERLKLRARLVVGEGEVEGATRLTAPPRPVPPPLPARVSPGDALTILQSSGTTGQPKAAALSHASYVLPAQEFVRWMEVVPGDRFLGCLPLFHMAGQAFAASAMAAGASLVLVSRFSAHHFWEQVRAHGVTLVRHLGEMLAILCRQPEHPDDRRHSLRAVYGGGARVDVAEEFERRFGVQVVEGYGLTETNTVLRNEVRARRRGSIGRALPYAEVRIADEQGAALPPGQTGEIQVRRNPVLMTAYVGPAELTAACMAGDWFRTGDLGYQDEEGYFYFTGRHKDIIRRRGENISPGSIEKVLDRHPAVDASAVVGVPDEVGGEEGKAYLVCRPGARLAPEDLVAWCRPWLADFEIPRYFEICAELPRTATNKINKGALRLAGTLGGLCYDRRAESGGPPEHPLSHGQRALWFLQRLAPESGAYHISALGSLSPALDVAALHRATRILAAHRAALRTTFHDVAGEPRQRVHELMEPEFSEGDASAWSADQIEDRLIHEAYRPFDLETGPLLRIALLRRSGEEHLILLVAHHLVCDFWTLALLTRELGALYGAEAGGPPEALALTGVSYVDHVREQRERMAGPDGERLWEHWRDRLAGIPPALDLPADRPRPPVQTYAGDCVALRLGPELSRQAGALARSQGATLFMAALAAFDVLLHRHTGEEDLAVGTPTAGRRRADLAGTAGYFVNPVVMRTDLSGAPGFTELLGRVRQTALEAFEHQDYPFALLAERLHPARDASRSPLFQVMFLLQKARRPEDRAITAFALGEGGARMDFGGSTLASLPWRELASQLDLTLRMGEVNGELAASLLYNPDLFDATTARRMLEHFAELLRGAVASPSRRISELSLLSDAERHQLLEWNATAVSPPEVSCLQEAIEAQARRTPDAVAVSSEGESMTYGELASRAGALARHLRSLGIGSDVPAGICAERSLDLMVGLVGILAAGGAYVPLDPSYPAERLAHMLEDSRAPVVLVQRHLAGSLPRGPRQVVLEERVAEKPLLLWERVEPESLAYIIYTSGSTGRPKGAMNSHGAILNRLLWMQEAFGLGPEDRVLQKTPVSFDVSVWELFWPLLVGARLVLARPGGHQDPSYLVELIAAEKVTTVHFVPSMLQAFLAAPGVERCASLRRVIASGEALPHDLQERCFGRLAAPLFNLYGPTEAAVDVTWWACQPGGSRPVVPIGRPIANTAIHLVDGGFAPVPVGAAGELLIGGVSLARGYVGRPELTAERFVPDPWGEPGARLYRTGDLARWRADGAIEYLGRLDHQVKVRGFRIELQEIEAALTAHPAVREAAVVVREDLAGGPGLVAYVVPASGGEREAGALRDHLLAQLPPFMVPAHFVVLDALPLNPSGKADRKALTRSGPLPERPDEGGAGEPRTPAEELLAGLFSQVLRIGRVGVRDSFFELGGHSLLASQLVSRIEEAFGAALPLRAVFEAPTVAGLAARVDAAGRGRSLPPITRVPRQGPLPLSFAQQRLWFLDQMAPGDPTYNIPAAVRLTGRLDRPALAAALGEITRRHEVLRTCFATAGGGPVQVIAGHLPFDLPLVDLRGLPGPRLHTAAGWLARREARQPFDLAGGPLVRGTLAALGEEEHVLLLTLHHIVSDGWSLGVLVRELGISYAAISRRQPVRLPELEIQYADFAAWQRRCLTDEELRDDLDYWRDRLASAPPSLELPADRPRPMLRRTVCGTRRRFALPPALAAGLRELSRQRGATLFMTLLAAFETLLGRHSGQSDIPVGTPVAGRNRLATEDLIGFFVNTLVLRCDLAAAPLFLDLLAQVREATLSAYAHQDLPFERLVEELRPERDLSRTPLFQVMLVLQNARREPLDLPGLTAEILPVESGTAKFDLSLELEEGPEGLAGIAEYNRDLFDAATVARLIGHLEMLLRGVVEAPEMPLSQLPLLTAGERRQLLEWNATARIYPPEEILHRWIEAQAAQHPKTVAVVFEELSLTYGELNERANRLAHRLRRLGAGPEARVGIFAERSLELMVALLGTLKAGGAYVPLDPAYPDERLGFMAAEALAGLASPVVLTLERLAPRLASWLPAGTRVLRLDADWEEIAAESDDDPAVPLSGDNLAYVIYTSGSTGRPKGAMNTHRAITNRLLWMQEAYALSPGDRVLQKTPASFDVSVWEFFWPLLAGARLVLARPEGHRDGAYLVELIAKEGITTLHFVPSMLQSFLEEEGLERCSSLRRVVSSGEALPRELVRRFHERLEAELHNLYGPTEAAVDVTFRPCPTGEPRRSVPIGRPIANLEAHVLDVAFGAVPVGVAGELHLGGAGLGRGYLDRPDLTAERFVPHPAGPRPGERLYRTGDLGRWLADGEVEYLGRLDHQVKVRGVRIELGEIEAVLARQPEVREAVVVVSAELAGGPGLVAHVVPAAAGLTEVGLRDACRAELPEAMVPSAFVLAAALPLSANGKVDRKALARLAPSRAGGAPAAEVRLESPLEEALAGIFREVLRLDQVGRHANFFDLGGHSLLMVQVRNQVQERLGHRLTMLEMFRHPTVATLAGHLAGDGQPEKASWIVEEHGGAMSGTDIAIVGMAGRFPGARDLAAFWRNLRDGVESVTFFSEAELEASLESPELLRDPRYVPARAVLEDADLFDAELFGYSPREAEILDPQQRIFLECAWEAIESAGCDPARYPGLIGVFGGVTANTYVFNLFSHPELVALLGAQHIAIANDKDYLCSRVSYKLDLEGPSVVVQTACSTSLAAVHMASQALLRGECDMALAGGVGVLFPQKAGYLYQENGILSPDGHCRAFDAHARGSVGGQGVGIVVLKRLADALAEGDSIRAVIKGTAINNDGALKAGYTAPRVDGQARVIRAAQAAAGVEPDTISYIEAHGTGTELGDPIEIAALTQAFRARTARKGFCAVGSVKTNIGHLDAAAGVAGLIKTVLSLEHRALPPSLHFEAPNPELELDSSPFYVNARLAEWPAGATPRRAGVSSFGIGGTNVHAVLEEAPPPAPAAPPRPWRLLLLSARTETALETATARLAEHLESRPDLDLDDVAFTSQAGRKVFEHRRALVCGSREEAVAALRDRDPGRLLTARCRAEARPVAFLFSGLGDHYTDMGLGLYQSEPGFRHEVDRCCELLAPVLGSDLRDVLYPGRGAEPSVARPAGGLDLRRMLRGTRGEESGPLDRTELAQPALFVVEYALARLWMSWGVRPRAVLGYSLGEYTAACIAGVLSLEDALALVARRARLIQELPAGAMLAVPLSERETLRRLGHGLSLSAVNGPELCVIGGVPEEIAGLERRLTAEGLLCRRLRTSHAFHSTLMETVAGPLLDLLSGVALQPPRIPILSNVTGTWLTEAEATDPAYWVRHLLQPVRFGDGIAELGREPGLALLEVGPGQSLGSLVLQHPVGGRGAERIVLPALRHEHDRQADGAFLLRSLAQLWLAGVEVDWSAVHAGEGRRRVPLPAYPFERQRFFVERREGAALLSAAPAAPAGKSADMGSWFYLPSWRLSGVRPAAVEPAAGGLWLLLADAQGVGLRLAGQLEAAGREVVVASAGAAFARLGARRYVLDPADAGGYDALLAEIGEVPERIVHLWSLTPEGEAAGAVGCEEALAAGFYSLLWLTQALAKRGRSAGRTISVVTNGLFRVERGDRLRPEKATLLGPVRVIPQELPGLRCRAIDVDAAELLDAARLDGLAAELDAVAAEPVVARRGTWRWLPEVEPARLEAGDGSPARLRSDGVYLITGGLGGLGLALAEHLARTAQARLVLLGRSALPERALWPQLAAGNGDQGRRIRGVQTLEALGAEVLALSADVTDAGQVRETVEQTLVRFGRLDGVFHAAGLPGAGLIQLKTREAAAAVLAPKIQGTLALADALADVPIDFMVLFSSVASVAGGVGQVDYCAANAFLGAFAQGREDGRGFPVVTVDWCEWQWDGWTGVATPLDPRLQAELDRQRRTYGLTFEEGLEALRRILASGHPRALVSTRDLPTFIAQQHSLSELLEEMAHRTQSPERRGEHPRPVLGTPYVPPASELESRICELWQELLGVDQVGIHDNFFQLGGHSLLGLQVISRLRDTCQAEIPLRALFEAPTVAELALTVDAAGNGDGSAALRMPVLVHREQRDAQVLLENLDLLSEEEMDGLLAQMLSEQAEGGR